MSNQDDETGIADRYVILPGTTDSWDDLGRSAGRDRAV